MYYKNYKEIPYFLFLVTNIKKNLDISQHNNLKKFDLYQK